MAKNKSNKKEYLISQGYDKKLINFVESCGVDKYLVFITSGIRKNLLSNKQPLDGEFKKKIEVLNEHLLSFPKNPYKDLNKAMCEALVLCKELSKKRSDALYEFEDGFFIVNLKSKDLVEEANEMSNCVKDYEYKIYKKECAILALKNKKGKTMVHFEILRNGSLFQNFEKSNREVKIDYWKYIIEFFEKNSKNLNFDNLKNKFGDNFDFVWKFQNEQGKISICCVLPTQITAKIKHNKIETKLENFHVIKKFHSNLSLQESYLNNIYDNKNKKELVKELFSIKNDFNKKIDGIIEQVKITEARFLYISDEIKEKLFGNKFLLKGENYNVSELITNEIEVEEQKDDFCKEVEDFEIETEENHENFEELVKKLGEIKLGRFGTVDINKDLTPFLKLIQESERTKAIKSARNERIIKNDEDDDDGLPF